MKENLYQMNEVHCDADQINLDIVYWASDYI